MFLKILHTNDLHGTLDQSGLAFLKHLRSTADVHFDSGDSIKTGNLGIPLKPEPVWPMLAELDCTASVPGNRESHLLETVVKAKFSGHSHPVLCANWRSKGGELVFPGSMILEHGDARIGIFGVMVPMVTAKMKTQAASQYLWTNPLDVAVEVAEELRSQTDFVIALTHIGYAQDRLLAERGGPIDLILGGHSHTVLESPVQVGKTWIAQGGSHSRYAGVYEFSGERLSGGLVPVKLKA